MENSQFKILAIDDTADNLLVLKALMSEFFPMSIYLMAQSGKKGIEICLNEKPDIILLDIIMPQMDGYDVCRMIKENPLTKNTPIIMITAARNDDESRIKAFESGADAFLSKPIDETELKIQIQAMLRIKQAEDKILGEKALLEKLVHVRTAMLEKELDERKLTQEKLQTAIASLEKSKQAALNLMEDLQTEMFEKLQTQEVLSNSEERFRLVFENTPLGMISFTETGIITACNDRFIEIIGSSREKLIGLNMNILPDKEVVAALNLSLEGQIANYEGLYKSFTAEKQSRVKVQFAPIFNKEGVVKGGVGLIEDISEQYNAEMLRKQLEERFKKSFYSSPVAISITRMNDGAFIDVNDAYCRLTGYSREQLLGNNVINMGIISEQMRNHLIDKLKKQNFVQQSEIPLYMRNNDQRIILLSVESYKMEGEEFLLSTLLDITERKQYELELTKLTRAVEQSPVSIVITNLEGDIEYVNPKVVETTGYLPGELIGKNPRVLNSGEKSKDEYLKMYETIALGEVWQGEFHNKKKNGELYWEWASISAVINDDGVMTHYLAVKEDITQSKAMQTALKESEELYRNIFMNNPLPMWIYDVDTLAFVEVNQTAIEKYGYTREEFLKMTLKDIRPAEDIPALLIDVYNKEGYQKSDHWRHKLKNGEIINVEITSHSLPLKDNQQLRMVMSNDITERLKASQAMEEAKLMAEASDKLKTAFLNNISHEVRTPLNGIMGASMLISDPDLSRDEIPELVEIINLSTERLIRTITDYMDISLITSGNMEVNKKKIDLSDLHKKIYNKYIDAASGKNISLLIQIKDSCKNHVVNTDEELINKALDQLINNAIKFTESGTVEIGCDVNSGWLQIYVKDSGIGINKESIDNIFKPFSHEDTGSSRRHEGSGLGLTIVKGITDLLGGKITVESEKNKGSAFYIDLPLEGQGTEVTEKELSLPKSIVSDKIKKNVILIAEDDDTNFTVMEMLIKQTTKSTVIRALNGQEAVDICLKNMNICLVLMDIKMPVMNGLEATKLIKAQLPDLTILALTAYAMSGDEHMVRNAGCDDYIAKPVSIKELKAKLESYGIAMK
ncbi:MAG: PAS domain S-box protein [Bacteroidales bacterium]|nr:PAS domain S-box protein [Bacteroidales bacterium]